MSDRVILIVESNPKNTSRLQLSEELRVINDIFENNDQYKIVTINAARISDFGKALATHAPEIVHFLGHGEGENGLCFHDDDGKKQLLTNTYTDQIFELASGSVKFVFLNACHSEVQAKVIAKNIDYVLGMSDKIPDDTASNFAASFYQYIVRNKPVDEAFKWARVMSGAVSLPDHLVPVLLKRDDYKDYPYSDDEPEVVLKEKPETTIIEEKGNTHSGEQPEEIFAKEPEATLSKITPISPFLIIPTAPEYNLIADKHYRVVEAEIEGYWGLLNSRRVSRRRSLERELGIERPDFVYVYTKFKDGQLLLDNDQDGNTIDLDTLALWFKQAGLRPFLVLVLHRDADKVIIPDSLKNQTQFIWCLSTQADIALEELSDIVGRFFKRSGHSKTNKLIDLISDVHSSPLIISSHVIGHDRELAVDAKTQRSVQQFRAALLRIMLGREEIKLKFGAAIQNHLGNSNILIFAVVGSELSCVFDLPQQIYFHMLYERKKTTQDMLIINWPLHIQISAEICAGDWPTIKSINEVISYNIQHGSADLSKLIEDKAETMGISAETGAIVFHWNVSIDGALTDAQLKHWLTIWSGVIEEKFSRIYSPKATLVHALCIKVKDKNKIDFINEQIRHFLINDLESKPLLTAYSRTTDPLSTLKAGEIEDFFNESRDWSEHFRFKNYSIDKLKLAKWVVEKTAGEFENVVQTLWQSQLNNYDEFLQDVKP